MATFIMSSIVSLATHGEAAIVSLIIVAAVWLVWVTTIKPTFKTAQVVKTCEFVLQLGGLALIVFPPWT
jgi:hypothetical protein